MVPWSRQPVCGESNDFSVIDKNEAEAVHEIKFQKRSNWAEDDVLLVEFG